MLICPRCGVDLEDIGQSHECSQYPASIDAYIAIHPEPIRSMLSQVRETIRSALPDSRECISWRMPTYWDKHNIIHFAASKNHIGIYPGSEAIEHFAGRLKDFRTSKGAIQLPYAKTLPLQLIADIAKWCHETVSHH